jgi:hypothetical protein
MCLLGQKPAREELPPERFIATYLTRIVSRVCDVEDAL